MSYIHKKTGNLYSVLGWVLDATNGREGHIVVIYCRNTWLSWLARWFLASKLVFARDQREFDEKFTNEKDWKQP